MDPLLLESHYDGGGAVDLRIRLRDGRVTTVRMAPSTLETLSVEQIADAVLKQLPAPPPFAG